MPAMLNPYWFAATGPLPVGTAYEYNYIVYPWSSQATWPAAIYDSGLDMYFFCWEAVAGVRQIWVQSYDVGTDTWSKPYVVQTCATWDNSHSTPAMVMLSDKRLAIFYGPHNGIMFWSYSGVSSGEPVLTSWTQGTGFGTDYTYPKPVNVGTGGGAGVIYFFARSGNGSSGVLIRRKLTYTSGGAPSVGAEQQIVNTTAPYSAEVRLDSAGDIEMMLTDSQSSGTKRVNVYYVKYHVATGTADSLSNLAGTRTDTTLPISLSTANTHYREFESGGTNETGFVSWCRDGNGNLHMAYGNDEPNDGDGTFDVGHQFYNGSTWSGGVLAFQVHDHGTGLAYVNDWCLVPNGNNVEAYYPVGGNGSWTRYGGDDLARKTWSGGTWGAEEIIYEGDEVTAVGWPSMVQNSESSDGTIKLVFSETGQSDDVEDAVLGKMWVYGESGGVDWDEPASFATYQDVCTLNFEGANNATTTSEESPMGHLHTVSMLSGAKLDTTVTPPWGTSWLFLDGTNDYVTVAPARTNYDSYNEWHLTTGDTVEYVWRFGSVSSTQYIVTTRKLVSTTNTGWWSGTTSDGKIYFGHWNSAGTYSGNVVSTTAFSVGDVVKVGIKRTATAYELYIDGTLEASLTIGEAGVGSDNLEFGRNPTVPGNYANGRMLQFRKTNTRSRVLTTAPSALFETY